jgi:hypothetical protein
VEEKGSVIEYQEGVSFLLKVLPLYEQIQPTYAGRFSIEDF